MAHIGTAHIGTETFRHAARPSTRGQGGGGLVTEEWLCNLGGHNKGRQAWARDVGGGLGEAFRGCRQAQAG
jgi:hypothetical protein